MKKRNLFAGLGIFTTAAVAGDILLSRYFLKYALMRNSSSSNRKVKSKIAPCS